MTRQELQQALKTARANGMELQVKLTASTEALQAEYDRVTDCEFSEDPKAGEWYNAQADMEAELEAQECTENPLESADEIYENFVFLNDTKENSVIVTCTDSEKIQTIYNTNNGEVPNQTVGCNHYSYAPACSLIPTSYEGQSTNSMVDEKFLEAQARYEIGQQLAQDILESTKAAQYSQEFQRSEHDQPMIILLTTLVVFYTLALAPVMSYVVAKVPPRVHEVPRKVSRKAQKFFGELSRTTNKLLLAI